MYAQDTAINMENVNKSIIDSKLLNALLKDGNISIFSDAYHNLLLLLLILMEVLQVYF